jgi:nucleotide-binding universal stress UspA family protein
MHAIRTVLCPVDLSAATARQIDIAADLCRAFGARFVLHHNFIELAIGAGVGWMWAVDHSVFEREVEQRLLGLLPQLPDGIAAEVRVTHGPAVDGILEVARTVNADLVVLSTRGPAVGLDGSVTERVLEHATLPVFAIHHGHDNRVPRFTAASADRQVLLVPTDLTPVSQPALDIAYDLARRFAFDVLLLHVLPENRRVDVGTAEEAANQLTALIPLDLPHRVAARVERGVPARMIADVAREVSAACIVMGEHARTPMRHWLRPDTSRGTLHPAPCPVWYVPGPALTAARTPSTASAGESERMPSATRPPASPTLIDELRDRVFHYWPTHQLYGIVDSAAEAESALADLLRAGVPKSQLQTWHGPEGKDAIDPTGEKHGRTARLWRTLERATPERALLDRYAAEVDRGRVCIGVRCGTGDDQRAVADILERHGGHLISYFSVGSVEHLSP